MVSWHICLRKIENGKNGKSEKEKFLEPTYSPWIDFLNAKVLVQESASLKQEKAFKIWSFTETALTSIIIYHVWDTLEPHNLLICISYFFFLKLIYLRIWEASSKRMIKGCGTGFQSTHSSRGVLGQLGCFLPRQSKVDSTSEHVSCMMQGINHS